MDWKLTRNALGEPAVDEIHPEDEDLSLGYAYLRALVAEYDDAQELAEGVYYFPKANPGKWI